MLNELLLKAEAIQKRIDEGNYSIEFYYYLLNSLELLLIELRVIK